MASARRVSLDLPEQPVSGMCDRWRIERVLVNLLSNAHKYSSAEVEIVIDVQTAGEPRARIRVTDHGIGIGLAGARQIVEQHGGSITVTSDEDHGSTFTVELPLEGPHQGGQSARRRRSIPWPRDHAPSLLSRSVEDWGIEPQTLGLQSRCSPTELIPRVPWG